MNANPSPLSLRSLSSPLAPLRKWLFAVLATLAVLGSAPEALAQTTVTLQATRDNEIYDGEKGTDTQNYGLCDTAYVSEDSGFISRTIVGFDLSSIPANSTITSATLRMVTVSAKDATTTPRDIRVHQITQAWTEGTGNCDGNSSNGSHFINRTTATPWTTPGGTFSGTVVATTSVGGLGAHTWNVTSLAQAWYATPSSNNGMLLKYVSDPGGYEAKVFATRNHATSTNRPQLTITYQPACTTVLGGATAVCVGSTANVTPASGGTWSSSNNAVATVTNGGVVSGVSAGSVTLTYTETATGCVYTRNITVNAQPTLGGTTTACIGATANVTPATGGTWSSSNNAIATVTDGGVVSGVSAGTVTLTFTDTSTGCTNTRSVTVNALTTLGGATSVCVGTTANVTPATGGTWSSSNNAIASVTNGGVVSGVSAGTVTLSYTNTTTGCISTTSFSVTAPPTLGGASVVCPGQTANVTPATGGTWSSSNNAIATVTNGGVVSGVSAGTVTLTFTNTTTGCTNTRSMTVNAQTTLGGSSSTCVGTTALVTPNTGGTWASSNNAIASVNNAGVVTGVSGGSVTLSFTNSTTGCVSTKAFTVSVPFGGGGGSGIGGATAVCAGFQTNVTPATGGLWSTSNASIATVTNAGLVTGFSPGTVVLTYTETVSGCVSTVDFNVYPNVVAGGASSVCQGAIANVTPTTNGTWVSSDPAIAFVNNSGFVTGLQPGTVTLTFTSLGGCADSKSFTVHPKPTALGAAAVQVGQTANVTPATGGTWISSNPAVATITNAGLVTGLTEGAVTLTFTDSVTGCTGTKSLTVIDPGFYKNQSFTDSGDKVDPDPENNDDPEVVFPQSFTALIVTVFQDLDGDGDGDQPVPNVSITLRDSQGTVVAVVTTGLDGSYTFTDLPPGFYTVTQTVPNGNFTLGDNPMAVSVVENDTVRADFINSQLGQISGTILADAGDEAMPNVLVSLLDENGDPVLDSNNLPITTTTNSAGFYLFDLVPPGTYQVQQTVPNGYTAVDDVDGTDLTINGDVTPIVILPGTVITNQDFVNFQPASITGNISIDTDINLAGDAPHVGVTVSLFRPGFGPDGIANNADDNNAVSTTVTDASGNFSFTGLNPGDYRVGQTVPSGYTAVADSDGGSFTVVGDVTILSVAAGESEIANFVNQPQTDIAVDKTVSNSTPVVGTNVTFTIVVTNNGPQNATNVRVDDVALGMLYVSHVASQGTFAPDPGAPANTFSGLWTVGALNVGQSRTLTVVATVTPNAIVSVYNNSVHAYSELGDPNLTNNDDIVTLSPVLGTISGIVRRDNTGDNLGDIAVAGVSLALVDQNGNPVLNASNVPMTTVSDVNGNYSFTGLPPGNYRVVETVPAGDVAVNDVDGGNRSINGDVTPIALAGGQTVANQNFVIAAVGSIAGTITDDTTGDKVGDSPLAGVVVILLQSNGSPVLDGNGDPITTITNGSGGYIFTNLTPGNYRVAHVPPGNMIAVDDVDGGNLTINGDITPIAVLPGQNVTGQNFVDSTLGNINGSVFADADNDGDGDTFIAGVTLTLLDSNGNVVKTTTSQATGFIEYAGNYLFEYLPPGEYSIVETQPAGYTSVSDADGGNPDIIGNIVKITVLPGQTLNNQDFVEILNATITGIVQADTNNDDIGDTPLAGVTVTLRDGSNNVVATTTTAVDGTYSFLNVVPGTYAVVETDPAGYNSITPNSVPVTLLPGGSAYVPFVDEQLGSISGVVNADTDGNGSGDTVLPNVTVTLRDGSNNIIATTTTGVDGSYSFPNLPPGTYTVVETDLPNYISLTPNSVPVTLTSGENEIVNFTDAQFASITGNVFNDTNRLTDNTVNGTGTNAGGIYINLVNPVGNLVIASIPVNVNGTYSFTQANGVDVNESYLLILTTAEETVGNVLTSSTLPLPWISVGENLGAGVGSDGTVNGILSVSTTVGALTQANFGLVEVPDVTPIITAIPNVMTGPTLFNTIVRVNELNSVNTNGLITVRIPKDTRWTRSEAYNPALTSLNSIPLENSIWTYSENLTHHIFQTTNVIPSGLSSTFGFRCTWNSGQTTGIFTMTSQIDSGSGSENRIDNNADAEKLDYFIN